MEAETLDKLEKLVKKSIPPIELEGVKYAPVEYHAIETDRADCMDTFSLDSLIGFTKFLSGKPYFFNVLSCTRVEICGGMLDAWGRRITYACADVKKYTTRFSNGQQYSQEDFIVQLQQCFEQTEDLDRVIDCVSKIKIENASDLEDDGVSQRVSTKGGVALTNMVEIPNPVKLRPFSTFAEIENVERPYILRVSRGRNEGVSIALHASDSRAWEMKVMKKIKEYLKPKVKGFEVV